MPELPEVETMIRGIRPHVEGRTIERISKCRCSCKPITITPSWSSITRRARGRTIIEVRRRAKRVVLELDSGDCFVIEPRMTGLMLLSDPPDPGHLRIQWDFQSPCNYKSLWFWDRRGLGTLSLFTPDELSHRLGPKFLGPDALEVDGAGWHAMLKKTQREIKVAMLDQKMIAGIGNLYASEILHRVGIHPQKKCSRVTKKQCGLIAEHTVAVLSEAIRYEGSTLSDGTYRNSLNKEGGYQNAHLVYDREEQPCDRCGDVPIKRIVQGQRSTFFCPICQRR
ncbi:MAG: formamidopyrimidine-DNA glycosylase [Planctomycetaceae bacterium]|nr:formamidopyrimidine-DNA glycosylase [Planctomycetaceae bacterium]